MNILYLSSMFPHRYSSTNGIYSYHLLKALSASCRTGIVCPRSWLTCMKESLAGPPKADELDMQWTEFVQYPAWYYSPKLFRNQYGSMMWRSIEHTVRAVTKNWQPDAILSYWAHPDGEAAVEAAKLLGVPSIIMVGGSDVLLLTQNRSRKQRILNVMNQSTAIVSVSDNIRRQLLKFDIPDEKIHVIYRGVDFDKFHPASRDESRQLLGLAHHHRLLLWVGRMVPVKGLDVLLKSLRILKDQKVDVTALLIGSGPLEGKLKTEVETLGINENVQFQGNIAHDHLPDWYRAADLTVLPSLSEGIPNVLLESISCGTPFVASRVGGIPEIATEPLDRLVPSENPQELARAIRESLERNQSEYPKRRFEPTDWVTSANQLAEVFESAIDRTNVISSAV